LVVTLKVFAVGTLIWLPTAFLLALGRLAKPRSVRFVSTFVVEFFRGSSAVVQLFFAFFVLPLAGIKFSPFVVAVVVLGLNEGSYASEIVRGALLAVPKTQLDAAAALGIDGVHRLRRVVIPQALPIMIPPFGNAAIEFLKFTSFVSLITVSDLTFRAQVVLENTFAPGAMFTFLLVAYYLLALMISFVTRVLEARFPPAGGRMLPETKTPGSFHGLALRGWAGR
jgi:polar amino acid transport system permease protein